MSTGFNLIQTTNHKIRTMPVNKNAYLRFQLINEKLQKGRYPSLNDLMDYLEENDLRVSRSTLEKDLEVMRNRFDLPIAYDRYKEGYYYTDPMASFDSSLSNEDVETVWMAVETLRQFRHSDAFKNVGKSLDRIMSRLKIDLAEKQEHASKVIYYEPEPYFAGSEWLSVIYDAIREQMIISFTFNHLGNKAYHELNPYFLKEFAGRWYVIGIEKDQAVTFGLDRIEELVKCENDFRRNQEKAHQIKLNIELNLGILDFRVRKHGVQIRFDASLADEIKSNPFLANQGIVHEDAKDIIVYLEVVLNEAFVRKVVFPYGDKATVLAPPFAVDVVVRTLTRMLDLHKAYASKTKLDITSK